MTLTEEQVDQIKKSLLNQLDKFPEEKREEIKKQIEEMSNQEVEEFVKQNQLNHLPGGCIFCAIAKGKSPSVKLGENEKAVAVLEINPLSKGNTLIIPKEHNSEITEEIKELAEDIKQKIKSKFNPEEIKEEEKTVADHKILELIPIYGDESERKQASEEELNKVKEELEKEDDEQEESLEEKIPKFKARIP